MSFPPNAISGMFSAGFTGFYLGRGRYGLALIHAVFVAINIALVAYFAKRENKEGA